MPLSMLSKHYESIESQTEKNIAESSTTIKYTTLVPPAGVNWMSKQKTDAATILDSTACNTHFKFYIVHSNSL